MAAAGMRIKKNFDKYSSWSHVCGTNWDSLIVLNVSPTENTASLYCWNYRVCKKVLTRRHSRLIWPIAIVTAMPVIEALSCMGNPEVGDSGGSLRSIWIDMKTSRTCMSSFGNISPCQTSVEHCSIPWFVFHWDVWWLSHPSVQGTRPSHSTTSQLKRSRSS